MKMDAVPGIPTTMWFTPQYTTEEMKVRTGNPNFVYEISCDQMCGKGHFSMRGIIVVEKKQIIKNGWLHKHRNTLPCFPEKNPGRQHQYQPTDSAAAKPLASQLKQKLINRIFINI
jgi:cytochrome c oxidase subunit 2